MTEPILVAGGCRTPFLKSGTGYTDLMAYDLARMALAALPERTGVELSAVDGVILGTVVQDMRTSNIAREAALAVGVPKEAPSYTVTTACISSNRAVCSAVEAIRSGQGSLYIAGGAETASDVPIRFRRAMRKRLIATQKYRKPADWVGFFKGFRPGDLLPEVPAIEEFSTGLVMGQCCDRLTALYGVTREEQDAFAVRSHTLAAQATEQGKLDGEVVPVQIPPSFKTQVHDNGFRGDTTLEKMARLRPAFTKDIGTATAANSSFLTDGASAVLVGSASRVRAEGLRPMAAVRGYSFVGNDNRDELLLGPAFAVPRALEVAGVELKDIDVVEIHEAFAGSVLAQIKCLESKEFGVDRLGRSGAVGAIEMEQVNRWGGSLSLGHPFGATGARLVLTCARRMEEEDAELGLVTACAAGGLAHAMVLERVS